MKNLVILGARQHAKVVFALLREAYAGEWNVLGFLDDDPRLQGSELLGVPVLGPVEMLRDLVARKEVQGALVGVSCGHMPSRARLFEKIQEFGLEAPSVISPDACIHPTASVGAGTVICSGAVVNAFATVGSNCVLYSNGTVEHECVLEDNVYIGPGVNFCADVHVGAGTFIGTGANVICERIGKDVIIGAGAAVVKNVPDGVVAAGVPARIFRNRSPEERAQSYALRHSLSI